MYKCRPYSDIVIYFNTPIAFKTQIFVFLYDEISVTVLGKPTGSSEFMSNVPLKVILDSKRIEVKETGNMLELDFVGCLISKLNNCCY